MYLNFGTAPVGLDCFFILENSVDRRRDRLRLSAVLFFFFQQVLMYTAGTSSTRAVPNGTGARRLRRTPQSPMEGVYQSG